MTTTVDEDRTEVAIRPAIASLVADKWYERGDETIALEFDKILVQDYPSSAGRIGDKWYERGDNSIALEFDQILIQHCSSNADSIADKWYLRGEKSIALKFDKILVQYNHYSADRIAEKWYERGDNSITLEFDKIFIQHNPYSAGRIGAKWYERGDKDIVLEFDKLYPSSALKTLDKLIQSSQFSEAVEYGNALLAFWVSQSDEDIQKNIHDKLKFAVRVESPGYYQILKSKLVDVVKGDITQNYLKFLENLPLNPTRKDLSITDYLTHRAYINPDFLSRYSISLEEARMMFEVDLYELVNKSDITFSILHVIALHAKVDPYFKLHIFSKDPSGKDKLGAYSLSLKRANLNRFPFRSRLIRGNLIHEWTHQLMDILFNNESDPYAADDKTAKIEWRKVMDIIWRQLNEADEELKSLQMSDSTADSYGRTITSYDTIIELYSASNYDSEAIARFAELIAMDAYKDPRVKEFLKPIYDYWMQYIEPAIEKYIKDHTLMDAYISDLEREEVLDPSYRAKIDVAKRVRVNDVAKRMRKINLKKNPLAYVITDKWNQCGSWIAKMFALENKFETSDSE